MNNTKFIVEFEGLFHSLPINAEGTVRDLIVTVLSFYKEPRDTTDYILTNGEFVLEHDRALKEYKHLDLSKLTLRKKGDPLIHVGWRKCSLSLLVKENMTVRDLEKKAKVHWGLNGDNYRLRASGLHIDYDDSVMRYAGRTLALINTKTDMIAVKYEDRTMIFALFYPDRSLASCLSTCLGQFDLDGEDPKYYQLSCTHGIFESRSCDCKEYRLEKKKMVAVKWGGIVREFCANQTASEIVRWYFNNLPIQGEFELSCNHCYLSDDTVIADMECSCSLKLGLKRNKVEVRWGDKCHKFNQEAIEDCLEFWGIKGDVLDYKICDGVLMKKENVVKVVCGDNDKLFYFDKNLAAADLLKRCISHWKLSGGKYVLEGAGEFVENCTTLKLEPEREKAIVIGEQEMPKIEIVEKKLPYYMKAKNGINLLLHCKYRDCYVHETGGFITNVGHGYLDIAKTIDGCICEECEGDVEFKAAIVMNATVKVNEGAEYYVKGDMVVLTGAKWIDAEPKVIEINF